MALDISQWLFEGIILKEKDFRDHIRNHSWAKYQDSFVALSCSTDAIVPGWAYMLVSLELAPYVKKVVVEHLKL